MRKPLAALLALALVAVPGAALSRSAGQTEEGTIVLPSPHPQAPEDCFAGFQRRFAQVTQEQVNSLFGHHFDIDKKTWGGRFTLEPTGGVGSPDLDIVFYANFDTDVTDPLSGPPVVEIGTREPGGEKGVVPAGMTKAIVCLWAGQTSQAAAASFEYDAQPPVKKKKKRR
ncbi:MAG: hypothetical protein ABR575_03370 [Actinomycetota bacterium]